MRRFESLLRPFAATPEGERPSADNLSASHIGELPPGHGRGPRSAEAWRREELRKLCGEGESTGWKAPARPSPNVTDFRAPLVQAFPTTRNTYERPPIGSY